MEMEYNEMNKFIRKILGTALISTALAFGGVVTAQAAVIVLDPGHGNGTITAPGAAVDPFYEAPMTLAVANQVKSELEAAGVTVYLTRTSDATDVSLSDRAAIAKAYGADALVSIHFNVSGPHDKSGCVVFASAMGGNNSLVGINLGNSILQQTSALGYVNKGVRGRIGTHGDYYGVIRSGTALNVPTIILEQCYIDYPTDRALLASTGLSAAAHADAVGIYNYLKNAGKI